ncbi:MAG TPA: HAMP domain-containing sensor histidine kinase, partial [Hyphomonadaceae bacterium]|nr:HAMP domain-containing sensor histidine kinase [Hyphomonadaceae bacterium]
AAQSSPEHRASNDFSRIARERLFILSIVADVGERREIVLAPERPVTGTPVRMNMPDDLSLWFPETLAHFTASEERHLKLSFKPELTPYEDMEVIVSEATLREALIAQSGAIILNALMFSVLAGAIVYVTVYRLIVRPMQGIADSVTRFSEAPEAAKIELPYGHSDEIRKVLVALETMQRTVSSALRQRKRLADLGEAVAKISHDLRNSLSAAQILSDGLADSNDPHVRDAAPRLERAIQRSITLAEATLKYGRSETPLPNLRSLAFKPALDEAVAEGTAGWPGVQFRVVCGEDVQVMADDDHLHRIITNLVRNAAKAITSRPAGSDTGLVVAEARRSGNQIKLTIGDNGPGVPKAVLTKLFQPFSKAGSDGGTGLGLAIARELARGMGGDLELVASSSAGSTFSLTLLAG